MALFLTAPSAQALTLGLKSSSLTNARVTVAHRGNKPLRARIVAVDKNMQEIQGTSSVPSTLMVTKNGNARHAFIRFPEGAFAVCAKVDAGKESGSLVNFQSCQRVRNKNGRKGGDLNLRLQNAIGSQK